MSTTQENDLTKFTLPVYVSTYHIEWGVKHSCTECALAQAIRETVREGYGPITAVPVVVDGWVILTMVDNRRAVNVIPACVVFRARLDEDVSDFVQAFDYSRSGVSSRTIYLDFKACTSIPETGLLRSWATHMQSLSKKN